MIIGRIFISLLPVILMALLLVLLDSYKLVKWPAAMISLVKGAAAAAVCILINQYLLKFTGMDVSLYSRYAAPLIEEGFKAFFVIWLIARKRIGFLVDAAIHGAAIGAGFAVIENIYFLYNLTGASLLIWFIRGFGTAIMHAACTALFAILCKRLYENGNRLSISSWTLPFLAAAAVHSAFNHFILPPLYSTLLIIAILPPLIMVIYQYSERSLRKWLTMSMDEEMALLEMILTGRFTQSKFGQYLMSLRSHFPATVVVDLLCYLRIYLELAMRAKGILLLRQNGIEARPDATLKEKFAELKFLEKSIGKTGKLALAPFMRLEDRELWQLYMLE